jgi:hypothetical protein
MIFRVTCAAAPHDAVPKLFHRIILPSMSDRDRAISNLARHRTRGLTLGFATLAGAAIGAVVALLATPVDQPLFEVRAPWTGTAPVAGEWPSEPRTGEAARIEGLGPGTQLVVVAPRAPRARSLAMGLIARRDAGVPALLRKRDALALEWRVRMREAASPELSPRLECAALLFARARQQRDLAAATATDWGEFTGVLPQPPAGLLEQRRQVALVHAAGDPVLLLETLAAEAKAEDAWFAAGVPAARVPFSERASLWRAWQLASADSLVALATTPGLLANPAELDSARAARELALVRIAVRTNPPYDALLHSIVPGEELEATPIARAWGAWLGFGALLGALGAFLAAFLGTALRRANRPPEPLFVPARNPGARDAWLHVVAGPTSQAVARATMELAAHSLARGERVLVVDGGPRLKLHERFGREARWGLMESLVADMPIIGLVQYGGRPGFYLLAHGLEGRGEGWAALGQRLDSARPHFARVVLALDLSAPGVIGDAIRGRAMEGWWAAPAETLPRVAIELSDRVGIALSGMDLTGIPEATLEAMGYRVTALTLLSPAEEPASEFAPAVVELEPLPTPAPEPIVLDCDLQVRQRLRFLAWMRRVQSERRRVEARTSS